MQGRSFWIALACGLAACGPDPTGPPGTWDVGAEPFVCTSLETGAATNDDPGTPRVLELRPGGAARVTLDDAVVLVGQWYVNDGDSSLPENAPGREPGLEIDLPDCAHAGAMWTNLGLRLSGHDSELSAVTGIWQLTSSRTRSVVHSMCTVTLTATRR